LLNRLARNLAPVVIQKLLLVHQGNPLLARSPEVKNLDTADLDDGLALGDQLLGGFELSDDLFGCMPGGFMVESPAQSGRMRTLIYPGPIYGSTSLVATKVNYAPNGAPW